MQNMEGLQHSQELQAHVSSLSLCQAQALYIATVVLNDSSSFEDM
jgi:hypothetical protein